jgi:hypothetical protein
MLASPSQAVKRIARLLLGDRAYTRITSVRSRNLQLGWLRAKGTIALSQQVMETLGTKVLTGPFKGMQYHPDAILTRHASPKLRGTYEMELHQIWEAAKWPGYDFAIDVGCAEGYYAVGIARAFTVKVIGFETDPRERAFCRQMAELNGVSQMVELRDWADAAQIISLCTGKRCLLLSDCEGYEAKLFDKNVVAALSRTDVVIEIHEQERGDVSGPLSDIFASTHTTKLITAQKRKPADFSDWSKSGIDEEKALDEHRSSEQTWMWCITRNT